MANPGDGSASDVPGRYDVVINGKGYVFADNVDPSLPFRTHKAIYDITPTFIERQNVSGNYGDNQQDFWLTATQNDWSLGEGQKFFNDKDADSIRRYWSGQNINVTVPGQASQMLAMTASTAASAIQGVASGDEFPFFGTSTNLYRVDGTTITDLGAHSAGALAAWGITVSVDTGHVYVDGATQIRKWTSGSGFTSFSNSPVTGTYAGIVYNNNTLYGWDASNLYFWDTTGNRTTAFTWKDADGTAAGTVMQAVVNGGRLAILTGNDAFSAGSIASVWEYDGVGVTKLVDLPSGFIAGTICVSNGVIFVSGEIIDLVDANRKTAVYYYANGQFGLLFKSLNGYTGAGAQAACAPTSGGIYFTDQATSTVYFYNITTGGASSQYTFTPTNSRPFLISGSQAVFYTTVGGTSYSVVGTNSASAATTVLTTSQFDLGSSLTKVFRGIRVLATGNFDIAYQIDGVGGAYTTLQASATSGTEYILTGVSGHTISVKVTVHNGGTISRIYVRAAPQLQQFRSGVYILACTGAEGQPQELRDGSYHALTGFEQANNLLTAAKATTPFSVTDKFGTFNALVDLNDPEGFDIYEGRSDPDDPKKPGAYLVRIKLREV